MQLNPEKKASSTVAHEIDNAIDSDNRTAAEDTKAEADKAV